MAVSRYRGGAGLQGVADGMVTLPGWIRQPCQLEMLRTVSRSAALL